MNNRYIFEREYYGSVSLNLIRTASDLYSRKNCNYNETIQYAAELSNGNCFYCGKNLKTKNSIISKEAIFDIFIQQVISTYLQKAIFVYLVLLVIMKKEMRDQLFIIKID